MRTKIVFLLAFAVAMLTAVPALACFSVVVGKNASATGEIIVGHNEDNDRRIVMPQYKVPRMKHNPGEMIVMEPTAAKIPQVAETWAYYWTETLSPDGYSFSDGYVNEWGVVIVSDSCISSREKNPKISEGGVGYGIRRIMAERATTAREAVVIATELLNKYGYRHGGRSYQISDKNEVWVLQVVRGNHYVAKRLNNDEVFVMANAYNIRNVDMNDKNNIIASPDLITYAISQGWYKPAKAGDYSDFDFGAAYQPDDIRAADFNQKRHRNALKMLMGQEYDFQKFPFSVKPDHKVTVAEVKAILSSHNEGTADFDNSHPGFHYSMNTVCNIDTQESVVVQVRDNPDMIVVWKSTGRPCTSGYVPFYPAAGVPVSYNWADPVTAQEKHFAAPGSWFDYNPARAWWVYIKQQNLLNFQYEEASAPSKAAVKSLTDKWMSEQPAIEARAATLLKEKREKGLEFLYTYTSEQAQLSQAAAREETRKLEQYDMAILDNTWSIGNKGNVSVVLFSKQGFDATTINRDQTFIGVAYSNGDSDLDPNPAKPVNFQAKDMNGDGMADMVITFKSADATRITFPGVVTDIYLRTKVGDMKVVAMDIVRIIK